MSQSAAHPPGAAAAAAPARGGTEKNDAGVAKDAGPSPAPDASGDQDVSGILFPQAANGLGEPSPAAAGNDSGPQAGAALPGAVHAADSAPTDSSGNPGVLAPAAADPANGHGVTTLHPQVANLAMPGQANTGPAAGGTPGQAPHGAMTGAPATGMGSPGLPDRPGTAAGATLTTSTAFAAMDRADTGAGGSLLHVSPHQVAVGVSDPGLGWIEVRAERAGGQVTAALAAGSSTTHAELTSILPAMGAYLNDHGHGVQQIHVVPGWATGQNGSGSSAGSSPQQGGQGERGQPALPTATAPSIAPVGASAAGRVLPRLAEGHGFSVRA